MGHIVDKIRFHFRYFFLSENNVNSIGKTKQYQARKKRRCQQNGDKAGP
jgi:hypothetical protein